MWCIVYSVCLVFDEYCVSRVCVVSRGRDKGRGRDREESRVNGIVWYGMVWYL